MASCGPGVCTGANAPRCVYYGDAYRMAQSARAEVQLMYPDLSKVKREPEKVLTLEGKSDYLHLL